MRRRSATNQAAGFSLFTFLDGLLCVMGAMIVVLAVIAPQAEMRLAEAAHARQAERAEDHEERAAQLATLQWRSEQLRISREKTAAQLEQQRLELSHIEDHARALRDQLAELESVAATLAREPASDDRQRAVLRSELAALTTRIAAAQDDLTKARRAATDQTSPSYAIIPYEGPNQTHRRPLYIECTADGVVLQPEGVVLSEEDFYGPLGPGNPLAATLRAAREYLVRNQRTNRREAGEPYPLLLVRPDGIGAYYAAREAMTSWGSDFGYELIDQDWKLDFKTPNPELAEATRSALEEARLRQRQLALAAPRRFADGQRPLFRASPTRGGVVREGGSHDTPYANGGGRSGGFGKRYGRRGSDGIGDDDVGDGDVGDGNTRAGSVARSGGARSNGNDTTPPGPYDDLLKDSTANGDSADRGKSTDSGTSTDNDARVAGREAHGGQTVGSGRTDAKPADGESADGTSVVDKSDNAAGARGGNKTGAPRAASQGSGRDNPSGTQEVAAGGPAAAKGTGQPSSSGGGRSPTASAAGSSGTNPKSYPNDAEATPSQGIPFGPTAKASLAQRRGKNWGLPDTVRSAVPITRPLRIDCSPDRLVVRVDENAARGGKVVALGPKTEDSIEELVSIVWEHIDSWGSAGRGMYWRPILSVDVQPGAADRFADLQILLADSGLDVRARGTSLGEAQPADTKRR